MTQRRIHMRGSIVGQQRQPGRPALGVPAGKAGEPILFEHTDSTLLGRRCGAMWGELAPPGDRPGILHWCSREMSVVPDPDGPDAGVPAASHPGRHRCTCGDYHTFDPVPAVVCRFPRKGLDGPECGVISVGLNREITTVKASLRLNRPEQKFAVVRSLPCMHVVRRGF